MTDNIRIDPDAIYDDLALNQTLGISSHTLSRARQSGELRYTRKGQRTLYVGSWVMDWLRGDGQLANNAPTPSAIDSRQRRRQEVARG
jgi:hypothetical protein